MVTTTGGSPLDASWDGMDLARGGLTMRGDDNMRRRMWLLAMLWLVCLTMAFPGVGWGAAITGRVIDAPTDSPLPSEGFSSTRLSLHIFNEESRFFERVAETRCMPPEGQTKQGCVDADGTLNLVREWMADRWRQGITG